MNRAWVIFALFFFSDSFAAENSNSITKPESEKVAEVSSNSFFKETPSAFQPKKPTPSRFFSADLSMPDSFATTNNLAKKTGSFYRAFGEIIFLQGTIVDSFGVPIDGVAIEIWQTNAAGKYHTLLEPNSEYIDKYFSMSGRTISDNLGNYHFITIMPGSNPGRAPHINMNLYHPKFGKLETEIYFADHPYNATDYQYLAYDESERKLVTASVRSSDIMNPNSIKLCNFDIVLKGIHQYKKY
jgi:protocatechuate 3,4-dioxygenase beta subunit